MARPATAAVRLLTGEREPVRLATTANIELSGLQTIDGVLTEVNDRVLVKSQTDARDNGIWTASEGDWYRASDAASSRMIQKGTTVHVQQGTANASHVYSFQTFEPNIGTDNIVLAFYQSDDTVADVSAAVAAGVATIGDETADAVQEVQEAGADILEQAADYAALARNDFVVDTWAGDGATTVFTDILSVEPGSANNVLLTVGNALIPVSSYTVVGRTVTFTGGFIPPGDGVEENIQARYGNQIEQIGGVGDGTITPPKLAPGAEASFRSTLDTYSTSEVDALLEGVKGSNIASSASIDLGAATGDFVDITGTTTITSFGTAAAGVERTVRFTGILTLTHNATSLILYSRVNITTFNGLVMRFRSLGSGNWVEVSRTQAIGTWTPGVAFAAASVGVTYGALNGGRYIKDGRRVTVFGCLNLSAKGSSTGVVTITGLPFTIATATPLGCSGDVGNHAGMSGLTGMLQLLGNPAATTINVYQAGAAASAALTDTSFTNTSRIAFSVTYEAAS